MECKESRPIDAREPGPVTVRRALQKGTELLSRVGIETARLDAELLLGKALGRAREGIYLDYEMPLAARVRELYDSLLKRRVRREPIAYITREREFWSLRFYVGPEVLVPRPETETLVEVALGLVKKWGQQRPIKILDVGTGSGAIAVALAKELEDVEISATDLSAPALEVAKVNAVRHGVKNKIRFLQGDIFAPIRGQEQSFDLLVSNPPYIRQGELEDLPSEVGDWEPRLALDGGADGLAFYRRLIEETSLYLADGGFAVLEIGADMGTAVCRLIAGAGCYSTASVYQDYGGKDRVVVARKLPSDTRS